MSFFSPGAIPLTGLVVLNARQVVHVGSFNSCGNCRGYFYAGNVPLTLTRLAQWPKATEVVHSRMCSK